MVFTEPDLTEIERIFLIQKQFNEIIYSSDLSKILCYFNKNPSEGRYNKIITYLECNINFNIHCECNFTFYFLDEFGKVIVSYSNNGLSTYDEYIAGLYPTLSEEQTYLNNLQKIMTTNEINENLLDEPIANVIINGTENFLDPSGNGLLYYLVGRKTDFKKSIVVEKVNEIKNIIAEKVNHEKSDHHTNKCEKKICNYTLLCYIYKQIYADITPTAP